MEATWPDGKNAPVGYPRDFTSTVTQGRLNFLDDRFIDETANSTTRFPRCDLGHEAIEMYTAAEQLIVKRREKRLREDGVRYFVLLAYYTLS